MKKVFILLFLFATFIISLNCLGQITTYPYSEGFEVDNGDWSNVSGDDFDWTRLSGGTPSTGTGPASADEGSFYMYVEASNPNFPSLTTYLEATFDFTSVSDPNLSFYYHMYGADMGTLYIDVFDGSWNLDVQNIAGQQHTSEAEAWTKLSIDLSAYGGESAIVVRLRGVTGTGFTSDIAIDRMFCFDACTSVEPGTSSASTTVICGSGTTDLTLSGYDVSASLQWQESFDNTTFSNISGATSANHTTRTLNPDSLFYYRASVTNGCIAYSDTTSVIVSTGSGATLPYSESFESGLGIWLQESSDGMDWTNLSGGTPSADTGPSGASDGSFYYYTEATGNNPDIESVLYAEFDFTGESSPSLRFDYHMFGTQMGELSIDVNTDQSIWSISGQQHTSDADPWTEALIDLSDYGNNSCVTIRIHGITGSGFQSDIAIDNIRICSPIASGTVAASNSVICGSGTSDLSLSGHDGSATLQWESSTDNITFNSIVGATSSNYTTVTLNPDNVFYYRVAVTNGCMFYSDTATITVNSGGGQTAPYSEGFETDFGIWVQATNDDFDITRQSGTTPSADTGPTSAPEGSFYLFTESSNPNFPSKTSTISAEFDFTGTANPELRFSYHMFGADMGTLHLDVNGDQSVWSVSGQQHTSSDDSWTTVAIDLSAYGNQSCATILFRGVTGSDFTSDICIDNVSICIPVAGGSVAASAEVLCGSGTSDLSLSGHDGSATLQWESSTDNITFNSIVGATSSDYTTVTLNPDNVFYYRVAVTNGCTYYSDTMSITVSSGTGATLPYAEDFETNFGIWVQSTNDDMDWSRLSGTTASVGTGPSAAANGSFYIYTEASGNFDLNTYLDGEFNFSATTNPEIKFYYHRYGESMGPLYMDVNNDLAVWSITGEQHSSEADDWTFVEVDLSAYGTMPCVTIRFRGVTGAEFTSDMCIDNIIICEPPVTSAISGSNSVCASSTGNVYSVTDNPPNTYNWIVSGGSIASGQGSSSVTIDWGAVGMEAELSVIENNGCDGDTIKLDIDINSLPTSAITGDPQIAANSTGIIYSVDAVLGNTYTWSLTNGNGSIASGQGTNSITVDWTGPAADILNVIANNGGCPNSPTTTLPIDIYAPITSIATGNWNTNGTWSCDCVPVTTDNVTIVSPNVVTLIQNETTNHLTIDNGASVNNGSFTLTVDGDYNLNGTHTGDGISGRIDLAGDNTNIDGTGSVLSGINQVRVTASKTILATSTIDVSATNLRLYTDVTITNNGTVTSNDIFRITGTPIWTNAANSILNVEGSLLLTSATLNASASNNTVNYNGASDQTVKVASTNYNDISFTNGGIKTLAGSIDVNGNLSITTATLNASVSSYNINLAGNWTNSSGTFNGQSGTVVFDGSSTQTITNTSGETFGSLTIGASSTLITSDPNDNLSVSGNWTNNGTFTQQTGTVTYNGTGLQTLSGTTTFNDIVLNNSGSGASISSGTYNVEGNVFLTNGNLATNNSVTLISNASGTGAIAEITNGSISGNITMQRYLDIGASGWRDITSPIQLSTIDDWMPELPTSGFTGATGNAGGFVSVYTFDESLDGGLSSGGWQAATNATNSTTSRGNSVYIGTGSFTMDVTGQPNTGTQVFNTGSTPKFSYTQNSAPVDSDEDGWNYIGNPYPCNINWNKIAPADKNNIDDIIYLFNTTSGSYGVYVGGGVAGTNDVDSIIPSCQAFWVHAVAASPSLTIRESVKDITPKSFIKSNGSFFNSAIKVSISSDINSFRDEAIVIFSPTSTDNIGDKFDAERLESFEEDAPSISTISAEGLELSINDLPDEVDSLIVPLKVTAGISGTYTIVAEKLVNIPGKGSVYLYDSETLTLTDLQTINSYSFDVLSTTDNTRFKLIFAASPSIAESLLLNTTILRVYPNPFSLSTTVEFNNEEYKRCKLYLYDSAGRLVDTYSNRSGNQFVIKRKSLVSGMYYFTINTRDKTLGSGKVSVR